MDKDPKGKSAEEILKYPRIDHSSWHFFQSKSWLDLATRTLHPSALHYSAFELRYGLEYLIFELLVLTRNKLQESEYKKCVGDPKKMKQLMSKSERPYVKLARFTEIAMGLDSSAPKLKFWTLTELFKSWGQASNYLHFLGAHNLTYQSDEWIISSIGTVESILDPIWDKATSSIGVGLFNLNEIAPIVKSIWEDYLAGKISEGDVRTRLDLVRPIAMIQQGIPKTNYLSGIKFG